MDAAGVDVDRFRLMFTLASARCRRADGAPARTGGRRLRVVTHRARRGTLRQPARGPLRGVGTGGVQEPRAGFLLPRLHAAAPSRQRLRPHLWLPGRVSRGMGGDVQVRAPAVPPRYPPGAATSVLTRQLPLPLLPRHACLPTYVKELRGFIRSKPHDVLARDRMVLLDAAAERCGAAESLSHVADECHEAEYAEFVELRVPRFLGSCREAYQPGDDAERVCTPECAAAVRGVRSPPPSPPPPCGRQPANSLSLGPLARPQAMTQPACLLRWDAAEHRRAEMDGGLEDGSEQQRQAAADAERARARLKQQLQQITATHRLCAGSACLARRRGSLWRGGASSPNPPAPWQRGRWTSCTTGGAQCTPARGARWATPPPSSSSSCLHSAAARASYTPWHRLRGTS